MLLPALAALALGSALALPAVTTGTGALAQTLCSEPVEPICATAVPATDPTAATDQEVARNRCIEDAQTYRGKLEEYRQCIASSLEEATAKVEAAAEFIQCLQDGEPDCRLRGAR